MPDLLQTPTVILATLSAVFFVLFVYQLIINFRLKKQPDKLLEKTQDKSYELLSQAIKKAENIIAVAELQGIKITSQAKLTHKDTNDKFAVALEELSQQAADHISDTALKSQQTITKTEADFKTYLESLSNHADKATKENEELIKQKINKMFENFEQGLSNFLTETQQQSVKAIGLEMQAARQLIQTYKQQQFNLVDENIVAMLEQTLNMVLAKKLSFKDQIDYVYEALEKAKTEKFIV